MEKMSTDGSNSHHWGARQGLAALQSSLDRPAKARLDGGGTSRVQGKGDGGRVLSAPVRACPVTLQKLPSRESAVNSRGAGSGGVTSEPWAFFLLGSSVPIPLTNQTPETRCVEWGQEATATSLAHTRDPELGQGCCCD